MTAAVLSLRQSHLAGANPLTLVDAWVRELDAAGRSPKTLAGHRWHLTDTFTQLATARNMTLDRLDVGALAHPDLVDYLAGYRHAPDRRFTVNTSSAGCERSDYTVARRTASLRTFFAWAAHHGHIPSDPAAGLPAPKIREHLPRAFDVDEARLVFKAAELSRFPERDLALAAVTLGSGPRLAELAGMRLPDLLGKPAAHILVLGKGGRERRVPLTSRAQDALTEYLPARAARLERWGLRSDYLWVPHRLLPHRVPGPVRLSRSGLADTFDRLLTDAGIRSPGLRAHVLRGTAATALLRAGRSVREVQALQGHVQLATTAKYLLVTDDDLADTVAPPTPSADSNRRWPHEPTALTVMDTQTKGGPMPRNPGRTVRPRIDDRLADEAQLLVRFNDDRDVLNALANALADAHLYRVLPGHSATGAVTVSVFIVHSDVEARTLTAGIGQHLYGLGTVGRVRAAGLDVVATDLTDDDGQPIPFSDRHADIVVTGYPEDVLPYDQLSRADRRALRQRLATQYETVLRLFDPRRNLTPAGRRRVT